MKARLTLLDDMLGTCSANPDIHREFIASKSRDADKMQEEMDALPTDTLMQKAVTVFARDASGMPFSAFSRWQFVLCSGCSARHE